MIRVFNASLSKSHFPTPWKRAVIKPIPKAGKDLSLPTSHRPISLLSCLGKFFEKIIFNRLYQHLDQKDLLHPEQYGFRPGHSTVHALARFSDLATHALRTGRNFGSWTPPRPSPP